MPVRPRGAWIPWLFVGFMAVVVAVNGAMIWLAFTTWTGLAADQPYDRGLRYNRNLDAAGRQAELGWRATLTVEAGAVQLTLTDAGGLPVTGADVLVRFERPTSEGLDFEVPLRPIASGVYHGGLGQPPAGAWNLHAAIRRGGDLFVHEQRAVLP
jgi:nitrogen fixation protein FixH